MTTLMDKAMTSNRTNWLAWIVIPSRYRNTWCNRRGEHQPVNMGTTTTEETPK